MLRFGLDIKNSQCHEVEITLFLMCYILKLINFYGIPSTHFRDDCHTHIDSMPIFQCKELESTLFVTHILELMIFFIDINTRRYWIKLYSPSTDISDYRQVTLLHSSTHPSMTMTDTFFAISWN